MAFDFKPRIPIPYEQFANLPGKGQSLNALVQGWDQGQQQALERMKQTKWQQAINDIMNNPNLPPHAKQFGPLLAANPQIADKVIPSLIRQMSTAPGVGKSTWYEDPTTGAISKNPTEGSIPLMLSDAQAAQATAVPRSAQEKNKAMMSRADAWNRSIDVKQINELAKTTGLTPKQQSALQQNNLRADRAISILNKPTITYQELALGEIDLAGIMQGGVPQVDEVKNTHFPGWQEKWGQLQTYATGHPTENVPPEIRQKVLKLVRDVVQIDNRFIQANTIFRKKMIAPTIRGGIKQFEQPINDMTSVMTTQPGESEKGSGGWGYVGPDK